MLTAEGLYREALEKLKNVDSYTKVMGLNFYGRMLLKMQKRENEATQMLKTSEQLATKFPYWYERLEHIYIPDFELD